MIETALANLERKYSEAIKQGRLGVAAKLLETRDAVQSALEKSLPKQCAV